MVRSPEKLLANLRDIESNIRAVAFEITTVLANEEATRDMGIAQDCLSKCREKLKDMTHRKTLEIQRVQHTRASWKVIDGGDKNI